MLRLHSGGFDSQNDDIRLDEVVTLGIAADTSVQAVKEEGVVLKPEKARQASMLLAYDIPRLRRGSEVEVSFSSKMVMDGLLDYPPNRRHVFTGVGNEYFPIETFGAHGMMDVLEVHRGIPLHIAYGSDQIRKDLKGVLVIGRLDKSADVYFACKDCGNSIESGEVLVVGSQVRTMHAPIGGGHHPDVKVA